MFNKIKKMFEDEEAIGGALTEFVKGCCTCTAWATACDTLFCGGEGIGKGIIVPICNEFMGLIFA